MLMDTTNGKYILSKTKKCLFLSVASDLLLAINASLLLHRVS